MQLWLWPVWLRGLEHCPMHQNVAPTPIQFQVRVHTEGNQSVSLSHQYFSLKSIKKSSGEDVKKCLNAGMAKKMSSVASLRTMSFIICKMEISTYFYLWIRSMTLFDVQWQILWEGLQFTCYLSLHFLWQ